jgi:ubiquinone/menaquinone biosynthesis C-methylase UbiE
MAFWTDRVVPRIVDRALSTAVVMELRALASTGLRGRVLEIGFGSGLNTELSPAEVDRVDAVEPSDLGWQLSGTRRSKARVPVERTGLDGQRLEAEDDQYDAVLSTFTLCTIPDVDAALAEVRRVLRPGGSFHFLEHGRAPEEGVERWQHRIDPVQRRVFGGCHLSRDIPALVSVSGLALGDVVGAYQPGPGFMRPWTYGYLGTAEKRMVA